MASRNGSDGGSRGHRGSLSLEGTFENFPKLTYFSIYVLFLQQLPLKNAGVVPASFNGGAGWNRTNYQVVMSRLL